MELHLYGSYHRCGSRGTLTGSRTLAYETRFCTDTAPLFTTAYTLTLKGSAGDARSNAATSSSSLSAWLSDDSFSIFGEEEEEGEEEEQEGREKDACCPSIATASASASASSAPVSACSCSFGQARGAAPEVSSRTCRPPTFRACVAWAVTGGGGEGRAPMCRGAWHLPSDSAVVDGRGNRRLPRLHH